MVNSLYQRILNKIKRIPGIRIPGIRRTPISMMSGAGPVVPFAPGRVYRTVYTNYKHDPKPLLFILSSDAFYSHAINIHYLGANQTTMLRLIMDLRNSNQPLTGLIMYRFMKQRYPMIPKAGYRLYFTRYLAGKLVSDGVSQIPGPNKDKFVTEPFVFALNKLIRPRVINKVKITQEESDRLKNEVGTARTEADNVMYNRRSANGS